MNTDNKTIKRDGCAFSTRWRITAALTVGFGLLLALWEWIVLAEHRRWILWVVKRR